MHTLEYRNASHQKPPKKWLECSQLSVRQLQQYAQQDIGVIWRGDYHQAKQLLAALKKRLKKPAKTGNSAAETFHKFRLAKAQQARLINSLVVEIAADFQLNLPRAPDVQAALNDVFGQRNRTAFLLPLNQLLGYIGAHQWHEKGVWIEPLADKIHVPFGVFSPLRGEYLDLLAQAKLPENAQTALDLGTGSGVLAALLAKRGIKKIIATDNNPRAIACAQANVARLGLAEKVSVLQCDLFAPESVDLIVCNPPWLPAKPTSAIETALYDPQHAMLCAVLRQAARYLNEQGQLWLIMSDLAEHLGLRAPNQLSLWFEKFAWQVADVLSTQPQHAKAQDGDNPLAFARQQENTYLYILKAQS